MPSSPQRPGSSSSATSTASGGGGSTDTRSPSTSTLYNFVMTPINFIAFVFSLVLIDLRYSLQRKHTHSESRSRLPAWFRALLYQPYEPDRTKTVVAADGRWYYHTKQKKLFKMEADEAFRLRNTMLVLLGLVAIGGATGVWYAVSRIYQQWIPAYYKSQYYS